MQQRTISPPIGRGAERNPADALGNGSVQNRPRRSIHQTVINYM